MAFREKEVAPANWSAVSGLLVTSREIVKLRFDPGTGQ